MNNIIVSLKNNFLFQASLGSKELFHSNLLAWILEQKNINNELEPLELFIKDFAGEEASNLIDGNYPTFRIEREQQNIDLTIKWMEDDKWNLIFIENKMKSIPTKKQLDEYDNKIDKLNDTKTTLKTEDEVSKDLKRRVVNKFLLTPFKNEVNSAKKEWVNITYEEHILNFLKKINTIDFSNPDIKFVLPKYIELIENQNLLLDLFNLGSNSEIFVERKYNFYDSTTLNEVKAIRLHDFVLKLAHQKISNLIKEKLSKEYSSNIVEDFSEFKDKKGKIFISHNFSRSTGISDVKICISKTQAIGLQLQGNSLKYVAETFVLTKKEKNKEYSFHLLKNKLWFYDDQTNEFLSGNGRDKNLIVETIDAYNNKKSISFNSYGLNFIYLNKDVSNYAEKSIGELVDFICSEVKRVMSNIEAYQL